MNCSNIPKTLKLHFAMSSEGHQGSTMFIIAPQEPKKGEVLSLWLLELSAISGSHLLLAQACHMVIYDFKGNRKIQLWIENITICE